MSLAERFIKLAPERWALAFEQAAADRAGQAVILALPLEQRLFNTRLALIAALDERLAAAGEHAGDADPCSAIRPTEMGRHGEPAASHRGGNEL